YFNYAHNCNIGIKKAMEYNPKWIVISNDDMKKIDDIIVLTEELRNLNNKKVDFLFTEEAIYHSCNSKFVCSNFIISFNQLRISGLLGITVNKIKKKFKVKYSIIRNSKFKNYLFKGLNYIDLVDFGIFSIEFLKQKSGFIFDETFINEGEDSDLSIALKLNKNNTKQIKYRIGDMIGSTLGTGKDRSLRAIAGLTYLNYKWESLVGRSIC
ncbi:MAG: hypothetical protein ACP5U0_08130, partial [Caldisphaera sp.]